MVRRCVWVGALVVVGCSGGSEVSPGFTPIPTSGDGGAGGDATTGSTSVTSSSVSSSGAGGVTDPGPPPPHTCSGRDDASGSELVVTVHDALLRNTWVHVPPSYDPDEGTMLVLNFHGFTSDAAQQSLFTGMSDISDERGFLVAYPNGIGNSWNAGQCCGTAWTDAVDDVDFVAALIDELSERYCVDPRRIYATGMSNGGFLSYRLGCEMADRIAAIAPVAGSVGVPNCLPSRPMPTFAVHGTEDLLVPYEGGFPLTAWDTQGNLDFRSVEESTRILRNRNGCSDSTTTTHQQGDSTCVRWEGCDEPVELCTVDGGGHTWPGGMPIPFLGYTSDDLDASAAMVDFFEAHPLPY